MADEMSNGFLISKYWYNPQRDGSLDQYLQAQFDSNGTFRQFKGVQQFNMLWNEGYFIPTFSNIRIMYNFARGDEHYFVIDKNTLSGIVVAAHAGKPGRHAVRDILTRTAPTFEAQHLEEDPEKRKIAVSARVRPGKSV